MNRELCLVCCVIRDNEIINETLFQSFDKIFEIAEAFTSNYGCHKDWGIGLDFEETVIEFANLYARRKRWVI